MFTVRAGMRSETCLAFTVWFEDDALIVGWPFVIVTCVLRKMACKRK